MFHPNRVINVPLTVVRNMQDKQPQVMKKLSADEWVRSFRKPCTEKER